MAEVLNHPIENMDPKSYKITPQKFMLHLSTVLKHKYYVFTFCCKARIPWRGIKHDMSKFSPAEFIPNVKYAQKGVSPIDVQKVLFGYASSWFHHKGRNTHHYEYWMDNFDNGCYVTRMPVMDTIECTCDMLAANRVYNGKSSREFESLWNFWTKKRIGIAMHPDVVRFLDEVFFYIKTNRSFDILNKKELIKRYNSIVDSNLNPMKMKLSTVIYENTTRYQ